MKLWDLAVNPADDRETGVPGVDDEFNNCGHWVHGHEPHTMLHPLPGTAMGRTYGINQVVLDGSERLLTAGADGKVKLWNVSF